MNRNNIDPLTHGHVRNEKSCVHCIENKHRVTYHGRLSFCYGNDTETKQTQQKSHISVNYESQQKSHVRMNYESQQKSHIRMTYELQQESHVRMNCESQQKSHVRMN